MLLKQFYLLVALAVVSVIASEFNQPHLDNNNILGDIIRGQLTRNSVLLYGGPVSDVDFEWRGPNVISRFEVLNLSVNGTFRPTPNIRGGLHENYLQLWSVYGPIDAYVRIFSEPNHQLFGWRLNNSVLFNTTRVTGRAPINLDFRGAFFARSVEIDDMTNGTGSFVHVHGLDGHTLSAQIESQLFRGEVDYIFRLYGEPTTPNNFEIGQRNASSVLFATEILTRANLSDFHMFKFNHDNHTVHFARLTDLTNGTGGRVLDILLLDDSMEVFFEMDDHFEFLLEVYGEKHISNDIIVGELQPGSDLLKEEYVDVWDTRWSLVVQTDDPIDRIEVISLNRRSRVRASLSSGQVGGTHVVVVFESDELANIHFVVRLFGRWQWNAHDSVNKRLTA